VPVFLTDAVEAIVGIIALINNELRIVQTSMLGSILSNLLLVLGCSFLAAGWKFKESNFQVTAAQASSSLLTLAGIVRVVSSRTSVIVCTQTDVSLLSSGAQKDTCYPCCLSFLPFVTAGRNGSNIGLARLVESDFG
jgi:calcium/proton exchanger cax